MVEVKRQAVPVKLRDERWAEQHWIATGEPLRKVVAWAIEQVDAFEADFGKRGRTPTNGDRRSLSKRHNNRHGPMLSQHHGRVEWLAVNLARAVVDPPFTGWVTCPLSIGGEGQTRYDIDGLVKRQRADIVWTFAEAGLLHMVAGQKSEQRHVRGDATKLIPSERFASVVRESAVTLDDFDCDPGSETIILKTIAMEMQPVDGSETADDLRQEKERIDYADTPEADGLRAWMRRFNAFMGETSIVMLVEGPDEAPREISRLDRFFRRYFSTPDPHGNFRSDLGGRLFSFGLSFIPRRERYRLRLEGEEVIAVDWSAMNLRLAHVVAGTPLPDDDPRDLYDLPSIALPRPGVKAAVNALLNGADRYPHFNQETRQLLYPSGYTPKGRRKRGWTQEHEITTAGIKAALGKRHPALNTLLYSTFPEAGVSLGYRLQGMEAKTLVAAIDKAMLLGLPLIPLHDAILVPASKALIARSIMEQAGEAVHGVPFPTKPKTYRRPQVDGHGVMDDGEKSREWQEL